MARKAAGTNRHAPEEIDEYLAALAADQRRALETVRAVIRQLVPDATERVSYGIPIFRVGKDLVGLSAQKNHCSLHTMSPQLAARMADDCADEMAATGATRSGATIHFPAVKPLPRSLVKRILRARLEELARTRA